MDSEKILLKYEIPPSIQSRLKAAHRFAWAAYLLVCVPAIAFGAYQTFATSGIGPYGLNRMWAWSMLIPLAILTPLIKRAIQGRSTKELTNEIASRIPRRYKAVEKSLYKQILRAPWSNWQIGIGFGALPSYDIPLKLGDGSFLYLDFEDHLNEVVVHHDQFAV